MVKCEPPTPERKELAMERFEIRFLDRFNVIVLVRRIFARDDIGAMVQANLASAFHSLEVWKEDRLVGRIERPRVRLAVSR